MNNGKFIDVPIERLNLYMNKWCTTCINSAKHVWQTWFCTSLQGLGLFSSMSCIKSLFHLAFAVSFSPPFGVAVQSLAEDMWSMGFAVPGGSLSRQRSQTHASILCIYRRPESVNWRQETHHTFCVRPLLWGAQTNTHRFFMHRTMPNVEFGKGLRNLQNL